MYILHPVDLPPTDLSISIAVLHASLSDEKLRSDPRIKKRLACQFDAVSNLITNQGPEQDTQEFNELGAMVSKDPRFKGVADPRLIRDPRLSKLQSTDPLIAGVNQVADIADLSAANYMSSTSAALDASPYAQNIAYGYPDVSSMLRTDLRGSFPMNSRKTPLLTNDSGSGVGPRLHYYGGASNHQLQGITSSHIPPTFSHHLGSTDTRRYAFGQENVPTPTTVGYGGAAPGTPAAGIGQQQFAANSCGSPPAKTGWMPRLNFHSPPHQQPVSTGRGFLIGTGNEVPLRYSYIPGPMINGPTVTAASSFGPESGSEPSAELPMMDSRMRRQPLRNVKDVRLTPLSTLLPSSSLNSGGDLQEDSKTAAVSVTTNTNDLKNCDSDESSSSATENSVNTGSNLPSLRERRKDLLYESPLSGAEKTSAVSEENKYNQPLTLKLKFKKDTVEETIAIS
ncbi:unnamed protein product [Soboliphyme baturini]|uniref:Protein kinase domain-containing protein n=1 Tax=Soboliphyme baturini TaxID=241478 RepID=A0A183IQK6_9BILA|nr:unnamed protein product [Soboliphyme baturini]